LAVLAFGAVHDRRDGGEHGVTHCRKHSPPMRALKTFSAWMVTDLHNVLNTQRFLMLGIVHPGLVQLRIMKHFTPILEGFTVEKGCEYCVALTVTRFMQSTNVKLRDSVVREVKYEDYVDPDTGLKPDLNYPSLHSVAQVCVRRLTS